MRGRTFCITSIPTYQHNILSLYYTEIQTSSIFSFLLGNRLVSIDIFLCTMDKVELECPESPKLMDYYEDNDIDKDLDMIAYNRDMEEQ